MFGRMQRSKLERALVRKQLGLLKYVRCFSKVDVARHAGLFVVLTGTRRKHMWPTFCKIVLELGHRCSESQFRCFVDTVQSIG